METEENFIPTPSNEKDFAEYNLKKMQEVALKNTNIIIPSNVEIKKDKNNNITLEMK